MRRVREAWLALDEGEQRRWHGVVLCVCLFWVHYVTLSGWFVEDAAISFSYARNLAEGEGLVAWPGGERVQGYSNPTWTFLLAFAHLFGMSPWTSAKLFGALFGAAALPLAYLWARRMVGGYGMIPVMAPLYLALSPQHVIWAASGLENAWVAVCLAAAAWTVLRQAETGGWPWSGLLLGLLALARPDAPLYAAVIGIGGIYVAFRERGAVAWRWSLGLSVVALVPFALWHLASWWYFAWPLPNTYYAKLHDMDRFVPLEWDRRGWRYLRQWALQTTWGFYLPLAVIVMTGLQGVRGRIGWTLVGITAVLSLAGAGWLQGLVGGTEPEGGVEVRVAWLALLAVGLPALGWGRRGEGYRSVAWGLLVGALFFALYSGGDWMKGHRWLATAQVPLAVLLADGAGTLGRAAQARWGERFDGRWGERLGLWGSALGPAGVVAGLLMAPLAVGHVAYQVGYLQSIETSPFLVYKRVRYMHGVQERLGLDHVVLADVDFGAQMWWTGHELVDLAGLNDVPIAMRRWERPFMEEYVLRERRPEFIHSHGGWGRRTGLSRNRLFSREYLEIPGYPQNIYWMHVGNHVRRDLFIQPDWGRPVAQFDGILLHLEAGERLASGVLHLHHGLRRVAGEGAPFRLLVGLVAGEERVVWDLPPGYDWVPPSDWAEDEVVIGRHALPLPETLAPGTYDLVFVMLGEEGVIPGEALGESLGPEAAAIAVGEVRYPGAVQVLHAPQAAAVVRNWLWELEEVAEEGRCEVAEEKLTQARRLTDPRQERLEQRDEVIDALARCWAAQAAGEADPEQAQQAIRTARRWDHRHPEVLIAGRTVADRLQADGDGALEAGELDRAHRLWSGALTADPTRSWLRRQVEALRAERLGLEEEE